MGAFVGAVSAWRVATSIDGSPDAAPVDTGVADAEAGATTDGAVIVDADAMTSDGGPVCALAAPCIGAGSACYQYVDTRWAI